jgi:predicted ATPase/DNA-binding CsgD family transcriptional regulator
VFIGREAALASFERVFAQVKGGQGQAVLVSGEAGIGKSRLVAEARARAGPEQACFLQGSCCEQDRALPFAPLVDLVRSLLLTDSREAFLPHLLPFAPELIKLVPDLALFLPEVSPTSVLAPEQEKRRCFAALTHCLLGLAELHPLVLVMEDLHCSDDTSLEFLLGLARHLRSRPLLLLLTYRREEVHPALAHFLAALDRRRAALECSLTPLTMEEVQAMLRAMFQLKKPVRRDFLETLYQLTEGNPFFVEEVVKSLLASGDIFFTEGIWDRKPLAELHIPRSVFEAVQQRSRLLPEQARETLELAAVVGRSVDVALLQALTGRPEQELLRVMDTLITAQLLMETEASQITFRHALTRAAIYRGLLAHQRKALHLTIAQAIERLYASTREAHLADLAYHFYQAEAWTEALSYGRRSGEKALALYAPRAALQHLSHALVAAGHLHAANPLPLLLARGQAHESLGELEAARRDFEQALQIAQAVGDTQAEWQSLMELGSLWRGQDYLHAGDFFRRALALAQGQPCPQQYVRSKNRLANWLVNTGHLEEGISMHEEAEALLQAQGETRDLAQTLGFLGRATMFAGDLRRSVSYYDQSMTLFRAAGDQRGLAASLVLHSATASPFHSEPVLGATASLAACQQELEEALCLARTIEWRDGQAFARLFGGAALASYGVLGEGLTHLRAALEMASEIEHRRWRALASACLGEVSLLLLDPIGAIAALEAGLALIRSAGAVYEMTDIVASLAQAYLLTGDLPRAEAMLAQALAPEQLPRNLPERRLAWVWGQLFLAQHKPELALRLADVLLASAPGEASRAEGKPIPALLHLRGEALCALGQLDEAIGALEKARRGVQEQGARPLLWQIHRSLARVYTRAHERLLAHDELTAAREVIAGLAAALEEPELRDRFVEAALASLPREQPLTPRQSASHAFGGLSERERAIARLIGEGSTNREIAEACSISQRTVETHLGRIYAKLGLSSRAQLAAWVVETERELPSHS